MAAGFGMAGWRERAATRAARRATVADAADHQPAAAHVRPRLRSTDDRRGIVGLPAPAAVVAAASGPARAERMGRFRDRDPRDRWPAGERGCGAYGDGALGATFRPGAGCSIRTRART